MECSKCNTPINDENRCCDGGTCCKACCDCTGENGCDSKCNCEK